MGNSETTNSYNLVPLDEINVDKSQNKTKSKTKSKNDDKETKPPIFTEQELQDITIYLNQCPGYILICSPVLVKLYELNKWVEFNDTYLFFKTELPGSTPSNDNRAFTVPIKQVEGNFDINERQYTIMKVCNEPLLRMWLSIKSSEGTKFVHMRDFYFDSMNSEGWMKFKK